MRPPPPHRATTANLQALYPFVSAGGLCHRGPLIGQDLLGGAFCFDPWELYRVGRLTNPNVVVLGQLGRGKSTFIKTLVWRELAFGRGAWIIDPKGEYGALARACGCRPISLAPGGSVTLNPLDVATSATAAGDPGALRTELISSLLSSSLQRALAPSERTAVDLAVRTVSARFLQPTLHHVVEALLDPGQEAAESVRTDRTGLAADGRLAALELRRMVRGDLAGMFDGATSSGVDPTGELVVLDLSATFSSAALPLVMTCARAWLQSALSADRHLKRLVVMDEAWAVLADLGTAQWAQATFKLSRALGVANVVVVHRISDLRSAGADGSAQQKLADGLLADSETRVVFGQPPSEAAVTGRMLGLTSTETDLVGRLPRGTALWRVAGRSHLVQHVVGPSELQLVDTDAAMMDRTPADQAGPRCDRLPPAPVVTPEPVAGPECRP